MNKYKTSDQYINSTQYQLFHYCFLIQEEDSEIPYKGFLKTKNLREERILNLDHLKENWNKVIEDIISIKLEDGQEIRIMEEDMKKTKLYNHCFFYPKCVRLLKSKRRNLKIDKLPYIRTRRAEMLNGLEIKTVKQLANYDHGEIWRKVLKLPEGKNIFQSKKEIKRINYIAKSFMNQRPFLGMEKKLL